MTEYLYSTKIWRFGDSDKYVIGKTLAEAAGKVEDGINNIEYVGTLLITKADMHVIFDPPPPAPVPTPEPAPVPAPTPVVTAPIGTGGATSGFIPAAAIGTTDSH